MAKTLLASGSAASSNTTSATTSSIDTAQSGGANLLVANVTGYQSNPPSISDSKSNSWTALTAHSLSAGPQTRIYYCINPITDAAHTFMASDTNPCYPTIEVQAWQFDLNPAFQTQNGATATAASTLQPGAVVPDDDDALLINAMAGFAGAASSMSISDGVISNQHDTSANNFGSAMAYYVQPTAASINSTWTSSIPQNLAVGVAVFKESTVALTAGVLSVTGIAGTAIETTTTAATNNTGTIHNQLQIAADVAGSPGSYSDSGSSQTTLTPFNTTGLTTRVKVWFRCSYTDDNETVYSNELAVYPATADHFYFTGLGGDDSFDGRSPSTQWEHTVRGSAENHLQWYGDEYSWDDVNPVPAGDGFRVNIPDYQLAHNVVLLLPITLNSQHSGTRAKVEVNSDTYGLDVLDFIAPITVNDLEFKAPAFSGTPPDLTTSSTWPGIRVYSSKEGSTRLNGIFLNNCEVHNFFNGIGIVTRTGIPELPPFVNMHTDASAATVVGIDNVRLRYCSIHDVFNSPFVCWGGYPSSGGSLNLKWDDVYDTFKDISLYRCSIYNVWGLPSEAAGAPNVIGIINASGVLIDSCDIHDNGAYAGGTGGSSNGPAAVGTGMTRYMTVRFCEIYNTKVNGSVFDASAIDFDGGAQFCNALYNLTHDNDGPSMACGDISGFSNLNSSNRYGWNVSRNDSRKTYGGIYTFGGDGNIWHNNTIYLNGTGLSHSPGVVWIASGSSFKFYSNVFASTANVPLVKGTLGGASFIGNGYSAFGGTVDIAGQSTMSGWRGTGQEKIGTVNYGALASDPLFKTTQNGSALTALLQASNVATYDGLSLQTGSPFRDITLDLRRFGIDPGSIEFQGYPNFVTTWDAGAYIFGSSALVPATGGGTGSIFGSPIIRAK